EDLAAAPGAARGRAEAAHNVPLAGRPGLGKTPLAGILAGELGVQFHQTSGPVLERKGDLAAVLTALDERDILFIDEIHRLNRAIEETLYPAMEDFQLDVMLGQGPSARTLRLDLPRFTLVGATTRTGLLAGPLRDRCGVVERLDYYRPEELAAIVVRSAGLLDVAIDAGGAAVLASRARGTPRIANRLLRRVRDVVEVRGHAGIDAAVAEEALALLEVDGLGLDDLARKSLPSVGRRVGGRPGRRGDDRRRGGRGGAHDGGVLGAVPPPGGAHLAPPARAGGHRPGVPPHGHRRPPPRPAGALLRSPP